MSALFSTTKSIFKNPINFPRKKNHNYSLTETRDLVSYLKVISLARHN